VVKGAFLQGFWQKVRLNGGVFVVNLWWFAGETWEVDTQSFVSEKHATSFNFIFWGLGFWFIADRAALWGGG